MPGRTVLVPMEVAGVTLLVEAAAVGGSEYTSSRLERAQDAVTDAFDRAQTAIVAVAEATVATIRQLGARSARPDEIAVKFGLKFAAGGSVIVAGASGEATLEVTLTYKHPERPDAPIPPGAPHVG